MQLSLQNFTTLVQNAAAAVQSSASALLDLTVGSAMRAVLEANAALGLWMQYLIVQVMFLTRAATSTGTDLDSWVADYGVTRLPGVAASGVETFSRYTSTLQAVVPVGAQVISSDGTQTYTVIADTTNTAYSAALGGFVMAAGVSSVSCTVVNTAQGTAGNVLANTVTQLGSAMPGIDYCTNAEPFTTGVDAESDTALRARFQNFLATRAEGTPLAVTNAIANVQQGLNVTLQENTDTSGAYRPGWFVVTVDDGTGYPPSSTISAVLAAVNAVRPIGSVPAVQAPAVTTANVSFTLTTNPPSSKTADLPLAQTAVATYINALAVGARLPYSRLAAIIYDVDPAITNVSNLLVNGGTADIVVAANGVVKAGTVTGS